MSDSIQLDDYHWLCGPEAAAVLDDLAESNEPLHSQSQRLRKTLSVERVHLLLEQTELRQRAKRKFTSPEKMFFTRKGFEQATDQWIAEYKAQKFGDGGTLVDLCCGIGGDLFSLGKRGNVRGIDRDPAVLLLAEANARALGIESATFTACDATRELLCDATAWHADPDRRVEGQRTTQIASYSPDLATLDAMHLVYPNAAIKLAPAATSPPHWQTERELEWISRGGECRQQVAWSGDLTDLPGKRRATMVDSSGVVGTMAGEGLELAAIADHVGRYVYEPDAAVLAAGLDGDLARQHGMLRITTAAAYLSADRLINDPLVSRFEILDQLPLRKKTIASYLRAWGIGRLEIKHRGVKLEVDRFRRELKLQGDNELTLIATQIAGKAVAIMARRAP